ncbi:MAG: SsgA family sporulation/cell division regulator [Mycobacteriales bacterium]|nr:SsgA family sporulation/cell division regulator [Frankia sp.]
MTDDVTTDVVVEDGGASGRNRRTVLRLQWLRTDPLAVTLLLMAEPDHPALPRGRWSMLRDFLRYGVDHPTGDGDVRLRPVEDNRIVIELYRAARCSVITVPKDTICDFLDATDAVLPSGEERSEAALDTLIERLLEA